MNAKALFRKTKPFIYAKLALGGGMVLVLTILLVLLMGIGWLFGDTGMLIGLLLWMGCIGAVRFAFMHYMGYLVKAGHIAVIAEACRTGKVPRNQVEYGKRMVKERFATANVYFAVDKLVSAAVKKIQRKIGKVGDMLDFIPGIESVTSLAQFFVDIALGYVDECCFGWTFYNREQSVYKSAADGVVIYVQNWKPLLKSAAITVLKTLLLLAGIALAVFIPVGVIFRLLGWNGFVAFLLACLIAWLVKFAYMDSYITIQMMAAYLDAAPGTRIPFDLYGNLCAISAEFKELFIQGQSGTADASGQEEYTEEYTEESAEEYTEESAEDYRQYEAPYQAPAYQPPVQPAPQPQAPAYVPPAYQPPVQTEAIETPDAPDEAQQPRRRRRQQITISDE